MLPDLYIRLIALSNIRLAFLFANETLFSNPFGIFNSNIDFTIAFVVLPKHAYLAISSYKPAVPELFFKQYPKVSCDILKLVIQLSHIPEIF